MPPITFEDTTPQPRGVRLGDLKERDTYLPYPCSPLSQVVEVLGQTADNRTIIRGFDGAISGKCDANEIVYPVSVKMVRADAPGCDATKQIVEDTQVLRSELEKVKEDRDCWRKQSYENGRKFGAETNARVDLRSRLFKLSAEYDQFKAELEDARKVAAASERYATAFQDDLKAAKTDADRLWTELVAVKTERDAWKARAEAYSRSVVQKCGDTFRTHGEDELCFLYADHATRYYEQDHRIPPAPKEANANA